jgi:23S rRNA (uracil1939-C5)-methyltransferase
VSSSHVSTLVDVEVKSIAAGGDGVARANGLVVFVPRSAPGDRATVRVTTTGRFARGQIETLLEPSPLRVEPPCPHYTIDRCGGCQIQHMRYDAQLSAKQQIVRDALERIGKRRVSLPSITPSPSEWRYRQKLTLALRRRGPRWIAGLHPYDDPVSVFDLRDCPITDKRVVDTWREIMSASDYLPDTRALRGFVRTVGTGMSFVLEGGSSWPGAGEFFEHVPSLTALWWEPEKRPRQLVAERADPAEPVGRASASFSQVNESVADELRAYVLALVAEHAPRTVVDAYAGVGDTAAAIARSGARVTAIELDRDASRWSARVLPAGSRAICGLVEELLATALPSDLVVLNPPRGGVEEPVTAALSAVARPPRAVIYVSCNPATLARDVARLPTYRIRSLRLFDMFPQTAHVETVCELVPEAA